MGGATNQQGQANASNQINQFLGNLKSGIPGLGADAKTIAYDSYGFGMSALYAALAAGAKEGGKLGGPIGWTGAVVSLVVGGAQSENRCDVIETTEKSIFLGHLFTVFAK
jgi:hypothetical protein